eukprot:CAMPEP_0116579724 /NCGR_PEP_ID=MMETSP0397-20121206/22404_1 /TAXON_ID=216820 /ORGANISM="Cyclophora tenuis, Strain ECT3854" /LENGTH=126 /DNA_ID=CAMNT_0004109223 /DNA_START=71 /DNA_END=448 /DNA_ORIENTATION=+
MASSNSEPPPSATERIRYSTLSLVLGVGDKVGISVFGEYCGGEDGIVVGYKVGRRVVGNDVGVPVRGLVGVLVGDFEGVDVNGMFDSVGKRVLGEYCGDSEGVVEGDTDGDVISDLVGRMVGCTDG